MITDNILLYEDKHIVKINDMSHPFYYFFDYDERDYDINMDFQHFHRFYEILILLADNAVHIIDGKPFNISMYDIVLLKPGILHKSQYLPGDPSKRIIINFKVPLGKSTMKEANSELLNLFDSPDPIFRFDISTGKKVFSALNDVFQLTQNLSTVNKLMVYHKFTEFLYQIYVNREKNQYSNSTILDDKTKKIFSITSYIHKHYCEPLSLNYLSKKFYISYHYLSHQFKEVTGFTITDYIQMTRVKNAQQLLMSTEDKISDIAQSCGFTSFSQFNRIFNKFCGQAPSQFRSQNSSLVDKF